MTLYYLSFCDPAKPTGEQFMGATIVDGTCEMDAVSISHQLGLNPGGEVAIVSLEELTLETLPADARHYYNTFIPRDEVMAAPHIPLDTSRIACDVCNLSSKPKTDSGEVLPPHLLTNVNLWAVDYARIETRMLAWALAHTSDPTDNGLDILYGWHAHGFADGDIVSITSSSGTERRIIRNLKPNIEVPRTVKPPKLRKRSPGLTPRAQAKGFRR